MRFRGVATGFYGEDGARLVVPVGFESEPSARGRETLQP